MKVYVKSQKRVAELLSHAANGGVIVTGPDAFATTTVSRGDWSAVESRCLNFKEAATLVGKVVSCHGATVRLVLAVERNYKEDPEIKLGGLKGRISADQLSRYSLYNTGKELKVYQYLDEGEYKIIETPLED